ncbi:LysM peptidoglycan-binding domain-containing protein [Nocardioides mangrovi]|uniref:LysM peptidoglycan-binding domain-containing protein n=1 Tax=Nocardioides mangrovi TaxID=2874580 RepID=A0ABS7U8K9_9ACTN|nr:LysM domain-containing protein [Nocardioides mangrovi]MBZ5737314.1 LysM peptidoglycan-binding domain-containing protein [Nocardioides mangrovi]
MTLTGPTLPRALAVVGAASAAAATIVVVAGPGLLGARATPDGALVAACAAVALLATAWLWLTTCVIAIAAVRGRTTVRGVPAPVRRVVLAACGVALVAGAVTPADATPGAPHEDHAPITGLPYPDRALGGLPGGAVLTLGRMHRAPRSTPATGVRVTAGDSLWSIAAADLGPGAGDAAVDAHWREIYRLNRAEIGPDPDLIRPAQRLRLPTPDRPSRR